MRVLLIDNDEDARKVLSCILEDAGFTVLEAGNVSEGLRLARLNRDIGVALVDIHLGDRLTGLEILASLQERLPFAQCVVVSGDWDALERTNHARSLRKPCGRQEVLAAVASAYEEFMANGGPDAMPKIIRRTPQAGEGEYAP
jgi:DNA-binding NtrC family response regulator